MEDPSNFLYRFFCSKKRLAYKSFRELWSVLVAVEPSWISFFPIYYIPFFLFWKEKERKLVIYILSFVCCI